MIFNLFTKARAPDLQLGKKNSTQTKQAKSGPPQNVGPSSLVNEPWCGLFSVNANGLPSKRCEMDQRGTNLALKGRNHREEDQSTSRETAS